MTDYFKKIISSQVHILLMPVYFILHTSLAYAGLLETVSIFKAFAIILSGLAVLFFITRLFYRDNAKAFIFTTITGALYLFFGNIKITFSQLPILHLLGHYKTLIPLLSAVVLFLFFKLKKSKKLINLSTFLNILFLLYIIIDTGSSIFIKQKNNFLADETVLTATEKTTDKLPDIYYIIMDGYPSSGYQQDMLNTNTNKLDSFLLQNDFYVINNSKCNYSNTAFSMSSTFGMNYINGIDTTIIMTPILYNRATKFVKNASYFKMLKTSGYRFVNLSIFDILEYPAYIRERFLSISSDNIIFYFTFWNCIKRDLFWQIFPDYFKTIEKEKIKSMTAFFSPQKELNNRLLDSLKNFQPQDNDPNPVFLYAHLKMPHFPYFYDSSGKEYPDSEIYNDSLITDRKKFAGYISYTNSKIIKLINDLKNKMKENSIIILQSDHSFADLDWARKSDAFRNYSAFYFPDKDYSLLKDSMSNVNTFRIILKKYFGHKLELLPYKGYYIK